MFYFKDSNYTVTSRPHKFNSEYLDGRLTLLKDSVPCYVVNHTPNADWSYDLKRLAIVSLSYGWEKVAMLNSKVTPATPPIYNSLIVVEDFWDYITINQYKDTTENVEILQTDSKVTKTESVITILSEAPTPIEAILSTTNTDTSSNYMDPIPIRVALPDKPNTVEPLSSDYVPYQQVSLGAGSKTIDALNSGHYPAVRSLDSDPVYRFKSPNIKNT